MLGSVLITNNEYRDAKVDWKLTRTTNIKTNIDDLKSYTLPKGLLAKDANRRILQPL